MVFENIFLYEHDPDAVKAAELGEAKFSSGGIRRKDGTYLNPARPAMMSVADFLSIFEGKERVYETDEHISKIESRLVFSEKGLKEIEKTAWLNNAIAQRTYNLTYSGFQKSLVGIDRVTKNLCELEHYIRQRDRYDFAEKAQKYVSYLNTDGGLLQSKKYPIMSGNIAEHLDQISSFIRRLLAEIENDSENSYEYIQVIYNILPPFTYVLRRYTALYYYENDGSLMPGNYKEWKDTIRSVISSSVFRDKTEYYICLHMDIPFKDKMILNRVYRSEASKLYSGVVFDKHYILSHSKEQYLSTDKQIYELIRNKDYYLQKNSMVLFLPTGNKINPE